MVWNECCIIHGKILLITMKQLFLNFLFFVASALVLVACAKIFPSQDKTDYPTSIQPAGNIFDKVNIKVDDKTVITGKTTFIKRLSKTKFAC